MTQPSSPWLRSYPSEVSPSVEIPDLAIGDLLLQTAARYPSHEALFFFGKRIAYKELLASAQRMAAGLQAAGIGRGDRVAIMLPNCPQTVIAYFGVLLAGAVVVMTNPLYVERELEHQLKDSGAVAIVTLDLLYPRLARVRGEAPESGPVPQLRKVIVTAIPDGLPFPKNLLYPIKQRRAGPLPDIPYGANGVTRYASFMAKAARLPAEVQIDPEKDIALLQYTGGTTGIAKGVMLTHRSLIANAAQCTAWFYRLQEGKERFLAALPLFHVFGLTVIMNLSVLIAGTIVLLPRFEIEAVLKAIRDEKPSVFPGAPTMYVALLNHPDVKKYDLSSINVCISGSAPLPIEVQTQFEALTGGRLIEGYGLTEAAPVTHANPLWTRRKIGTIGLPLPGTQAKVVALDTGEELPPGEIGELLVQGPQVMQGYWNKPEATAASLQDGWLRTGDLAQIDADGFFTIVDRIKDIIIAGGFNIYPREVEEVLYEHPGVRDAAVIGVKDAYRGETVKAFIVLRKDVNVSAVQLDRWCRERLAVFKVPHQYEFRADLPMTMIGKVLRRKLQEEEEQAAAGGDEGGEA
ncbi:long-chain-fatty-acid--CoA ligase [Paenibacillus sacheonensis]|uniref:AMP-binding protein n=1 Tax=Paenibacillus sacheonensis TaxID=742054 RepID=A0A7X5C1G9_9BACL|nr:long-chain fatty acid--CoA ligase [Paenibacillus sacheonensis]MBM7568934.1 long-chain acyl-CoA synthetase [Paenibacillus sacheonensis]NBC72691.1 AMP-binding protein [Paenibacillus sacheonensis]